MRVICREIDAIANEEQHKMQAVAKVRPFHKPQQP
jgi:hypothetical protein